MTSPSPDFAAVFQHEVLNQPEPLPEYDDSLCVRCFACTEVCPTAAIDNVSPLLVRLFSRGS